MPPTAPTPWAPVSTVLGWFAVSSAVALFMLVGVAVTASLVPVDPSPARGSILLGYHPTPEKVQAVFSRNLLVLAIHTLAAYMGAIIGRPHKPLSDRWLSLRFLHFKMPRWMERFALLYALSATLLSVGLQTTGLGFILRDIATITHLPPSEIVLLCTPHAIPELIGVFLPLGLFLIQAGRGRLRELDRWTWQAAGIALPIIFIAAYVEVYCTPSLLHAFAA